MASAREVLERSTTIAVVGASKDFDKPAGHVPAALKDRGFRVLPVNPNADELLGEKSRATLAEIDEPVDVVEVFRPAEEAPDIARQAVAIGAKALWLQLDIRSEEARRIAEEGGLDYVENSCMGVESDRYDIRK